MTDTPPPVPSGQPDPSLPPPPSSPAGGFCQHCGMVLPGQVAFCPKCGEPNALVHQPPPPAAYPPAAYPPPPPGYGYPYTVTVQHKTNGFAVAGLVLGIVWLYWIGSVLALIFGYVAKSQIDQSNGTQGGRGMAIAAIVLGWIGVGTLILIIILAAIGAASAPGT